MLKHRDQFDLVQPVDCSSQRVLIAAFLAAHRALHASLGGALNSGWRLTGRIQPVVATRALTADDRHALKGLCRCFPVKGFAWPIVQRLGHDI
jgi:hypothetical protein